mgnify:CR=1 FL=1
MRCQRISNDMNGDGIVTISDVWPMLTTAYHSPGNRALEALSDADFARSRRHVSRAMADSLRGWRRCGLKRCRRARRCKTALTQCVGVRHNAWPLADERDATGPLEEDVVVADRGHHTSK